jgi:hypothetical protein
MENICCFESVCVLTCYMFPLHFLKKEYNESIQKKFLYHAQQYVSWKIKK